VIVRAYFTYLTPPQREMSYSAAMIEYCRHYGNNNITAVRSKKDRHIQDVFDNSRTPVRQVGYLKILDGRVK
jgi:hypothetical protein